MRTTILTFALTVILAVLRAESNYVIHFDPNKSEIRPGSKRTIDSLLEALKRAGEYRLVIKGFCDGQGDDESNYALAKSRVQSTYDYLAGKGIAKRNMVRNWFGKDLPVASNLTETGKAQNRRVEIILLRYSKKITDSDGLGPETDLKQGGVFRLKNLNFYGGEARLLPEGIPSLKLLLKVMQNHPGVVVEIDGYVCCFDDMLLSVQRAMFVYNYLKTNGIGAERLSYKGLSNSKPVYEDETKEEYRVANRRVEIMILKN